MKELSNSWTMRELGNGSRPQAWPSARIWLFRLCANHLGHGACTHDGLGADSERPQLQKRSDTRTNPRVSCLRVARQRTQPHQWAPRRDRERPKESEYRLEKERKVRKRKRKGDREREVRSKLCSFCFETSASGLRRLWIS